MQRADISRTVEEIENRVVPGRILNRRKYRMRRSVMDFKDRLMGNDQQDYPSHWYAQPAAPLGPEYGQGSTQYSFAGSGAYYEGSEQGGGRLEGARERAGELGGRASETMHGVTERASGTMHDVSGRAADTMHGVQGRLQESPQMMRRQTQGNPMAMGLVAFGAGLLAATVLPETQKEKRLAGQATPQLQQAVEGVKSLGGEVAEQFKEPLQESVQEIKSTATSEAQALKQEATQEAQATKADVQSTVKE